MGGKRQKAKAQPRKGKGAKRSGNPAKAAQQAAAEKEKAASANPFGTPGGQEMDYEQAAAALDLPKDFSKFLK
jgi:signal recognition particle subunit SRP54